MFPIIPLNDAEHVYNIKECWRVQRKHSNFFQDIKFLSQNKTSKVFSVPSYFDFFI